MPTFDTPEPISVIVELGLAEIRIAADERIDTAVEVRPSDPAKKADAAAAEQTRVEYANGTLLIKAPKGWRHHSFRGGDGSIDVHVNLPTGSQLRGGAGIAGLHCTGRLGQCRFKTGIGDIHIDGAGDVELKSGVGDIAVNRVVGEAVVTTGSGAVRIGRVDGAAVIKNSSGDTWVGEVGGDLRVSAADGRIVVDHAHATVTAKTANGDVRVGGVARGAILAQTAFGTVEIGILDGVAAWLDLNTSFGKVDNQLDESQRPQPGENAVEVRGRTSYGDITIRRSVMAPAGHTEA